MYTLVLHAVSPFLYVLTFFLFRHNAMLCSAKYIATAFMYYSKNMRWIIEVQFKYRRF